MNAEPLQIKGGPRTRAALLGLAALGVSSGIYASSSFLQSITAPSVSLVFGAFVGIMALYFQCDGIRSRRERPFLRVLKGRVNRQISRASVSSESDSCNVLNLPHSSSSAQIRGRYVQLLRECHPDKVRSLSAETQARAHARTIEIIRAYKSFPKKKAA